MAVPEPSTVAPPAGLPAGLPDAAALARLAGEFFAALPGNAGGVPVPVNPQPAGVVLPPGHAGPATPAAVPFGAVPPGANLMPTSPQAPANALAATPALVPHAQAGNGVPDAVVTAAPGLDSRGGAALGVAPAYAAALPSAVPGAPPSAPSTAQSTAHPGASPGAYAGASPAASPGASPITPGGARTSPAGASPFYFIGAPGSSSFGIPAAADAGAPPATHPVSNDRVSSNGVSSNGVSSNGVSSNGVSSNGVSSNDVSSSGASNKIPAPADDRITAQAFGLPGAEALRALLAGRAPLAHAPGAGAAVPAAAPANFYFLGAGPDAAPASQVPAVSGGAHPPFDVHAIRRDFPILSERVNGRPLVWFDNAATTQKPQAVIDRLSYFYAHENSNIHRAAHELAARATDAYEGARETVRRFIGAASTEEIVFVRGTTEAINLVAKSWGARHIGAGDEIIVSHLEHHANIVPWQQLAAEKGAKIRVIPVDDSGQVLLDEYQRLLCDRTKIVAVTQVSNALGTVVPVKEIVELAHRAGACALVDGAQSVSHMRVDVREMNADFFVFSGHKIFGPTGIGVVYGKRDILEAMPPWQGGGNMIADVTFERTAYQGPPARFEAGTGNIADAVGLGAALEYVERVGIENIGRYEHGLLEYATRHMRPIPGVRLIGTARDKASVLSFVMEGRTTDEVGKALNQEGIAVRTGHHCAQPILRRFGLETTVRPSLAFYNTCEEVDRMVAVVRQLSGKRVA
jgi:cysteine desulfurase/selenocysteine lyase